MKQLSLIVPSLKHIGELVEPTQSLPLAIGLTDLLEHLEQFQQISNAPKKASAIAKLAEKSGVPINHLIRIQSLLKQGLWQGVA